MDHGNRMVTICFPFLLPSLPPSHVCLLRASHLASSVPSSCEEITTGLGSTSEQHMPLGIHVREMLPCIIRCQEAMVKEGNGLWTIFKGTGLSAQLSSLCQARGLYVQLQEGTHGTNRECVGQ